MLRQHAPRLRIDLALPLAAKTRALQAEVEQAATGKERAERHAKSPFPHQIIARGQRLGHGLLVQRDVGDPGHY